MAVISEVFAGWFGDRNKAIGANVYALTILLRVKPGRAPQLRQAIRALEDPFEEIGSTHFARLVVIDRLAFEGPMQDAPDTRGELLLFTAVVDGEAWSGYLAGLSDGPLQPVWDECVDAPSKANQLETGAFFWQYDATVEQAREALSLRERVRAFALANKYVTPEVLRDNFRAAFK
jgi:hypothetical protein